MKKNISKITTKGQVVIPKKFRDKFKISPSTKIYFQEIDGKLVMEPLKKYTPSSGKGLLKSKLKRKPTKAEIKRAIEEGHVERYLRSLKDSI